LFTLRFDGFWNSLSTLTTENWFTDENNERQ
jgi:hypothetical protein